MLNPFENAMKQLDRAVSVKNFDNEIVEKIKTPDRKIEFDIKIKMDNGEEKTFPGYRVEHNNKRGPYKGGIRFHHEADMDEVSALAMWMSLKTAIVGIPMGGGKGGIKVDPKELSKNEIEKLSRGWVREMVSYLGPQKDVPAPDVNTNGEIMNFMVDEYERLTGETSGATFTGKPLTNRGSEGREEATSLGGLFVFRKIKEKLNLPDSCRVVIQGIGNVGGNAAKLFYKDGHKIIALSDSKTAIFNDEGLNPEEVLNYKNENKTLSGFPGSKEISSKELLELNCDVLIPAALDGQITKDNAQNIKAKVVLELANGPTETEADDILFEKGVVVVPDILANAGGVTVSYFEWDQNLKGEHWSKEDVNKKLQAIMEKAMEDVYLYAEENNTDLRRGAFILALERLS